MATGRPLMRQASAEAKEQIYLDRQRAPKAVRRVKRLAATAPFCVRHARSRLGEEPAVYAA